MNAEVCAAKLNKEVDSCGKSSEKLNELSVVEGKKDGVELAPSVAHKGASLGPITPNPNRENGDFLFDFQSPLTMLSSPPKLVSSDSRTAHCSDGPGISIRCSPRTPKEDVFDPFAPGPDDMVLAPQCNKYFGESRFSVARRLNFDSSASFSGGVGNRSNDDAESKNLSEEDMFLESVFGSMLEAIILEQAKGVVLPEISPPKSNSDGLMTPTSAPRLTGVAETCPGAPMKPTRKSREIDLGICRKLEF